MAGSKKAKAQPVQAPAPAVSTFGTPTAAIRSAPTPAPMPQMGPSAAQANNIFKQSASALTDAYGGTRAAMQYQPEKVQTQWGYDPALAQAQQAAGGISTYMNPYTQEVIDTSMADLERQRQMQMNQLGAQASAARAFGGSRQGIAEAETNRAFAQQGGQLAAGLRQQGFQTALGAAQQDVATQLQAALANQAAQNAQQQFAQNLGLTSQTANQAAGLQGAQLRMGAAGQLGNLSQTGFNQGMAITQQQMQQGAMQQAAQQQLINAAKGQYAGFTGAPQQSLQLPLAALGGMPSMGQTTSKQPGLFDYLALGATAVSDIRLKENVQPVGKFGGVQFYTWDWNDEGKRIANPKQPTFGVMADEVAISHPQHVSRGDDGYLRVHYADLIRELEAA